MALGMHVRHSPLQQTYRIEFCVVLMSKVQRLGAVASRAKRARSHRC